MFVGLMRSNRHARSHGRERAHKSDDRANCRASSWHDVKSMALQLPCLACQCPCVVQLEASYSSTVDTTNLINHYPKQVYIFAPICCVSENTSWQSFEHHPRGQGPCCLMSSYSRGTSDLGALCDEEGQTKVRLQTHQVSRPLMCSFHWTQ